jgi:hypothetical protein
MILINLLPPELRKRQTGVSPVFASIVGGGAICFLLALLLVYVQFFRIPHARDTLKAKEEELARKTIEAQHVLDLEGQIAGFKARRDTIVGLLARKVYWARTLDEFANLLLGPWKTGPATVANPAGSTEVVLRASCLDLTVAPAPGGTDRGGAANTIPYTVSWHYKLMGDERQRGGDYINAFFNTIKSSPFWTEQGFVGKPEDTYGGDHPTWNADLQQLVIEGPLSWMRVKTIQDKALAGR